ncbi:c-type cytochrome [Bradyrhizobium iriomotense]|uniref:Cytochrome C n=1 Tax=Bradyrhizobium iriomotense TaxID=441950 RepID=A0ABQ6B9C0_9BRAD|nr:cytochrome c [Bradyrhizobium iriomotense]GLR90989.1 hypothetical protein GCM10007857_77050 [Bradyrhizobium iriomotense]
MSPVTRMYGVVAMVTALIASNAIAADDKEIIDYREHIMKTLNEQSAALGMMLSMAVPDDNAIAHMEAIALAAKMAPKAFEPKVQGGQSKPEVWTNWDDFSKRMDDFAKKTDEMVRVAKTKGAATAMGNIIEYLPCKSCHDVYRDESKK